ncbi:transcriptional regulator [Chlorobium phaeovibrioides]|uniref:Transcriptional regulator n=1 Tax=Chlorobium phaeovibrioides TaxID=1094 RepID=A0A432AV76_CHLPH|nr:type IV toxin-antitoxin system AbiEi family antitoxin domain-containing protein [Chlorobium phaeovibrioides]RTY38364.1 transcriptional regulator [Chlorobium phaeovibrioides]
MAKTLGPRVAQLLTGLHERQRSTFTLGDVAAITGLSASASRSLVHKAQQRGVVTRLKPGLFCLVPFELGRATEHVDSPYIIARELAGEAPYFISHGSAMELHRMVTQPSLTITVSCTRRLRVKAVGGYDFRFVQLRPEQFFGVMKYWVDKERFVIVSDRERTIVDCLRRPDFSGGITEVAKAMWMRRAAINSSQLVQYALQLDVGAVVRRLGYLLEYYGMAEEDVLQPLRESLTDTYQRLDPLLPQEGSSLARWRLQLNVSEEELDMVRSS